MLMQKFRMYKSNSFLINAWFINFWRRYKYTRVQELHEYKKIDLSTSVLNNSTIYLKIWRRVQRTPHSCDTQNWEKIRKVRLSALTFYRLTLSQYFHLRGWAILTRLRKRMSIKRWKKNDIWHNYKNSQLNTSRSIENKFERIYHFCVMICHTNECKIEVIETVTFHSLSEENRFNSHHFKCEVWHVLK